METHLSRYGPIFEASRHQRSDPGAIAVGQVLEIPEIAWAV